MENVIVNFQIFLGGGIEMLQDRINELDSAIVNVVGDWVYTIVFCNTERLNYYLEEGKKNWSSTGRYPLEELAFHNIKQMQQLYYNKMAKKLFTYNISMLKMAIRCMKMSKGGGYFGC